MTWNFKPALPPTARLRSAIAVIACALMTSACLGFGTGAVPTAAQGDRPKVETPAITRERCQLYVLPESPTLGDLEIGYATRGAEIVSCDARREVAVMAKDRQDEATENWERARDRRRSRSCRWLSLGC